MSKSNVKRGLFRLTVLAAIVWAAGMGWYQLQQVKKKEDSGITIQLSKDSEFHIDATGIKHEDKKELQAEQLALIFLPSLLLLLLVPVGGWVTGGFKS